MLVQVRFKEMTDQRTQCRLQTHTPGGKKAVKMTVMRSQGDIASIKHAGTIGDGAGMKAPIYISFHIEALQEIITWLAPGYRQSEDTGAEQGVYRDNACCQGQWYFWLQREEIRVQE